MTSLVDSPEWISYGLCIKQTMSSMIMKAKLTVGPIACSFTGGLRVI